jgi:predicted SAM-dependent methyltransferase
MDLEKMPWPWVDNSVDEIYASHVLEHLVDPLSAIMEIHRVLKPGGNIKIIVPHANGILAHAIGHKYLFGMQWFQDLSGNSDHQNDVGKLFADAKFYLRVTYHNAPQKRYILPWQWFWNYSFERQRQWDCLGIIHPGEIEWTATKTAPASWAVRNIK